MARDNKQIKPLISVIIPAYNTGRYISNIIDSLLKQTMGQFEILIVDDGSTDSTADIAESLLAKCDKPWRVIKTKNHGVSAARNLGIQQSTGDWIICVDSDDYIDPIMLEKLYDGVISYDAQCAFCSFKTCSIETISEYHTYDVGIKVYTREEIKHANLTRRVLWALPTCLIKKEVALNLKYDIECPYSEDTLYTWELIYSINKVVHINSDLYNYFQRNDSKQHTLTVSNCIKAIRQYQHLKEKLILENKEDIKFIESIVSKFILGAFHVLSQCVSYREFASARKELHKLRVDNKMLKSYGLKLFIYDFLFRCTPVLFYSISKLH